jgi:hypothetical protein
VQIKGRPFADMSQCPRTDRQERFPSSLFLTTLGEQAGLAIFTEVG